MARYISLIRFTEKGAEHIKDSTKRARAFDDAAEKAGIKIVGQYWTIGSYDGVLIVEAESERNALHWLTELVSYDVIVGVVLLGAGEGDGDPASTKHAIARHIIEHMPPGTRMVLREPHGLGKLLYGSVELGDRPEVDVTRHVPEVGPDHPYRSGLVVADRR